MWRKGQTTEKSDVLAAPDEAPKADAAGSVGDGEVKAGVSVGGGK